MKLEWVILAEGLGQDAKGAITAIGLNQNLFIAPTLPSVTKRAIFAHFTEDPTNVEPGRQVTFTTSFISPSGKVIASQTGSVQLATPIWPNLPTTIDLPAEMFLNCTEYGAHKLEVRMRLPDDEEIVGSVDLHVRQEAAQGPPSS